MTLLLGATSSLQEGAVLEVPELAAGEQLLALHLPRVGVQHPRQLAAESLLQT